MIEKPDAVVLPFLPRRPTAAPPRHGKRRLPSARVAVPLRWPQGRRNRYEILAAWEEIAMRALHEAGGSFRLVPALRHFVNMSTGELWPSNESLARRSGG